MGCSVLRRTAGRVVVLSDGAEPVLVPRVAGGGSMSAADIDNAGRVIGSWFRRRASGSFTWTPGQRPVARAEGLELYAYAMNDHGWAAGFADPKGRRRFRAVLAGPNGVLRSLFALLSPQSKKASSEALALNNRNEVCGDSAAGQGYLTHSFFWSAATGRLNLIDLVDPADPLRAVLAATTLWPSADRGAYW
jgi:hypothetical protein